jgi:GNAT superfamily N-acetyltransferase
MPVEHARLATSADIPAVAALWAAAVTELDGQRGGRLLAGSLERGNPVDEALAEALVDQDRLLVVGIAAQEAVGFCAARRELVGGSHIGVVDAVYVRPSSRQAGVATAMIGMVVTWCTARGCTGIDAPALPGSRPAKAFFEHHGFVARLLVMHHRIPAPGD